MQLLERLIGVLLFRAQTYAAIARDPARTAGAAAVVVGISALVGLISGLFLPSPGLGGLFLAPGLVHGSLLAGARVLGWGGGWLAGALAGALLAGRYRGGGASFGVLLRLFGYTFLFGLFWPVPALGLLLVPIGCLVALTVGLRAALTTSLWFAVALATLIWGTALLTSSAIQARTLDLALPPLVALFGIPDR